MLYEVITEDAASLVVKSTSFPCYQATEDSIHRITDLALQAEVKAALFDYPQAAVFANNGAVRIQVKVPETQEQVVRERIESVLRDLEGVS